MSNFHKAAVAASLAVAASAPAAAWAFPTTFTASGTVGGSPVSAQATFSSSGSTLTIVLTETSPAVGPGQLLDGFFFDLSGATPTLGSAPLPTAVASNLFSNSTTSQSNVVITGSWLLAQPVNGFQYGLSAVGGGGLFSANQFTLGGGGDDYGIAGDLTSLGDNNFKNKFPLIEDTVTFTLTGLTDGVTGISGVEFAFNSTLSDSLAGCTGDCGSDPPVPEPSTLAVFGLSLVGLGSLRRRTRV